MTDDVLKKLDEAMIGLEPMTDGSVIDALQSAKSELLRLQASNAELATTLHNLMKVAGYTHKDSSSNHDDGAYPINAGAKS